MKKLMGLLAALVLLTPTVQGQDAVVIGKSQLEAQTARQAGEKPGQKPGGTTPNIAPKTTGPQLTYQGFLVEMAQSGKPLRMIDPRQPANSKKDSDNLHRDPQTGKVKGFVLFAIKF